MTSEQQLAERCAKGERTAFKELYDIYAGRLLSLCMRYSGDLAAAEDILQDSFITIISSFDSFRYRGSGSLYAWLSRVVANKAVDKLREKKKLPVVTIEEGRVQETLLDNEEIFSIPEKDLLKMIEELPPGYRTVFNMFALDGFSHKEIARSLGIREKTSSSQYSRARAMLAGIIKEYLKKNG